MATLASDITSNFLADNQVPYRSLPASLSPFTAAGRTALGSLVTSATAIAAGAVVPWTCGASSSRPMHTLHAGVGHRSDRDRKLYRPYPQYGTIDTGERGWRPDRPFHLPRR